MYFVMYDRFLNSLGETYILESWSRIQRAADFDELKITGEQVPYSVEPFFVVANDRQGKMQFSGLASTPVIDDKQKKTTISLKDYMTLFNTDVLVDWSQLDTENLTLAGYLEFLFNVWLDQTSVGFDNIFCDVREVSEILWDTENIPLGTDTESVLLYTLIKDAMNFYELYCLPVLDVYHKSLTFRFYPCGKHIREVRLRDFGIEAVEKSFGEYNRATVYSSTWEKQSEWALTENNSIVKLPSQTSLVYPAKNRNFIADEPSEDLTFEQSIWNATYDAVMSLADNRYQENIDLDLQRYKTVVDLTDMDFSYRASVYAEKGWYRTLPVGEIETDSKGKHIIRLGHRVQELTQEI